MASSMGEGLSLTAVARARTGKQWQQFDGDENKRLFPYIEWLPSRSATPRETHRVFWHCRWRKDDNFWKENQPGTLWNCKCDWEQTDEEPDHARNARAAKEAAEMVREARKAGKSNPLRSPGLEGNPATTGQLFTDTAPYISSCSKTKSRKIERWAATTFRGRALENIKQYQGKSFDIDLEGKPITVQIDRTTKSHIGNDVADKSGDFLIVELTNNLPERLKCGHLVAHEENNKKKQKPSALHYYYYAYETGGKTYYYHVEENNVEQENRHFYRLYSITDKLRDSAIPYK